MRGHRGSLGLALAVGLAPILARAEPPPSPAVTGDGTFTPATGTTAATALEPEAPSRPANASAVSEPAPRVATSRALVPSGAALVGLGAALALGGGVGFGVRARNADAALDQLFDAGNPRSLTFAEAEAIDADGRRFEALQVGMIAGGSVVAVTGAVLLALGRRTRDRMRLGAGLGRHRVAGLSLSGRF